MKKIFEFTVPRLVKVKQSDSTENEKGETVITEKEVEKSVDQKIVLRKPTRSLYDEAELYYGVILSEGIKAGLLTRALLAKRFNNDGGTMADQEKDEYAEMYMRLFELQNDLERVGLIAESEQTADQKEKLKSDIAELTVLKDQIRNFEKNQASLFEQTGENRARNKTVLWWCVHLAHEEEDGKLNAIFPGETLEEKMTVYDSLEESEDDYYDLLLRKILYYVSFWYVGRASTQEEFEELLLELGETEEEAQKEAEDNLTHEHEDGTVHSHEGGDKEHSHDKPEDKDDGQPEAEIGVG